MEEEQIVEIAQELTLHISIGHADKTTAVWTLFRHNIERKIINITTATAARIGRIVLARVDIGAKIVVVTAQKRSKCPFWRSVHSRRKRVPVLLYGRSTVVRIVSTRAV